jgi:hypothetical protein
LPGAEAIVADVVVVAAIAVDPWGDFKYGIAAVSIGSFRM